jgi:hypothetical protein
LYWARHVHSEQPRGFEVLLYHHSGLGPDLVVVLAVHDEHGVFFGGRDVFCAGYDNQAHQKQDTEIFHSDAFQVVILPSGFHFVFCPR